MTRIVEKRQNISIKSRTSSSIETMYIGHKYTIFKPLPNGKEIERQEVEIFTMEIT